MRDKDTVEITSLVIRVRSFKSTKTDIRILVRSYMFDDVRKSRENSHSFPPSPKAARQKRIS